MREPAKTFEDLLVWQKAHLFVLSIYRLSGMFPKQNPLYKKLANCWKLILRAF